MTDLPNFNLAPKLSCVNCVHFQETTPEPSRGDPSINRTGICRRIPPVPIVVGMSKMGRPMVQACFPGVDQTDYCAEFRGRVQPIKEPT